MAQHRNAAPTTTFVQLPLIATLAIYARVATTEEQPPQSRHVDQLISYASELGYVTEQVTVFCDEGAQAAAPLLERQGYTALLTAIRERAVTVILLRAEDRIFADATEVQVNTFIHLCIETGVFVVTPQMMYDFQDLSHVALFRFHCVTAFQVIEDCLKVKAG